LAELREKGFKVDVRTIDVRSDAEMERLTADIRAKYGPIDAVLHGAGLIEDRLISDKTPESFDRVFDTKAAPIFSLAAHLEANEARTLILFGSIAGRFGNRGQADYAAANEFLNRAAHWFAHERPGTRVICVNWGPWASIGMASDAVNSLFRQRGIEPIETTAGTSLLVAVLHAPDAVEIIAGAGDWEASLADEPQAAGLPERIAVGGEGT